MFLENKEHSLNSKDYYELICWLLSWMYQQLAVGRKLELILP